MTTLLAIAISNFPMGMPSAPELNKIGFDPVRLARVGARLEEAVKQREVAGVVALVARNGKVAFHSAYGYADAEGQRPMNADTVFQVMSMTKPFVGVAIVQCAESGLLNLDDPVEKYLPKFGKVTVMGASCDRKVTIRHLLTHTSGLGGDDPGGMNDDTKRKMTLAQYADLIGSEPLRTQPGEAIRYSGVGINAAARIVEIVTGQSFEGYVSDRVLKPCGMSETWFFLPERERGRLAKTYGEGRVEFGHDRFRVGAKLANGAGGLYSTCSDMAKFMLKFSRQGGGLVSPAGFRAMTSSQTGQLLMDGSDERGFGLTFNVVRASGGTMHLRAPGSYGHTGAFCTEFWADPATGVVAVFMSQGFGYGEGVRKSFNTLVNAATK